MLGPPVVILIKDVDGANNILSIIMSSVRIVDICSGSSAPEVVLALLDKGEGITTLMIPTPFPVLLIALVDQKRHRS